MREERRLPIRGSMAAIAVYRRGKMVRGLKRRNDSSSWRVTLHALRGRPSEDALDVTPLTGDLCVPPCELKAGGSMVKLQV